MTDGEQQRLVRRLIAGDDASFEQFFGMMFPGLYRYAISRMNRDADAAEEVVQVALSKAVVKLHTFRGDSALFTWLCTFCRYEISAFYRARGREPKAVELTDESPEVRSAVAKLSVERESEPDRKMEAEDRSRMIHATLDEISPRYADVLEWKYTRTVRWSRSPSDLAVAKRPPSPC